MSREKPKMRILEKEELRKFQKKSAEAAIEDLCKTQVLPLFGVKWGNDIILKKVRLELYHSGVEETFV